MYPAYEDDLNVSRPRSDALRLLTLIGAAGGDGMNIHERLTFLFEWADYNREFAILLGDNPDVPGLLSLRIMNFWVALRRGWGAWRPSSRMLSNMRESLRGWSDVNHGVEDSPPRVLNISASSLPRVECLRLHTLLDELPMARFDRLFENWAAYEVTVDDTRLESEAHFSRAELRLDRLERLIREERCINARRIVRNGQNTPQGLVDEYTEESDGGVDD